MIETTYPAPEVEARLATELEIPRGAARMAAVAVANGWMVRITYARGTWPGRVPRVVDSIALRVRRDATRAVGIWLDGSFHSAHWTDRASSGLCNATQLRMRLEAAP